MKVVIVEDELLAAHHLEELLLKLPGVQVVKLLPTVKESVAFFKENTQFDLLYCDIQLGDGSCFDIFQQAAVDVPVIFCTAYNQYALQAFKNNGIDYILKPFTESAIAESVEKYQHLTHRSADKIPDYPNALEGLIAKAANPKVSSLLINFKGKILPIKIADVAIFTINNKMAELFCFNNQKYLCSHNLDELEEICGDVFYRANRQFLVNRSAIDEVIHFFGRKLLLKLKLESNYEVFIPKNKVPEFLNWLSR